MSVEYAIICDRCAHIVDSSSISARHARECARTEGCRVALPGGEDYCAECSEYLTSRGVALRREAT